MKSARLPVQLPASRSRRCFSPVFVFLLVGWTAPPYFVTALSIGGIVCIASSNGGTTSQDLKTGFLVGSTPKYQQIAILIGTLASCLAIGPILMKLNESGTVYIPVAGNKEFTFASAFHANPADFEKDATGQPKRERLAGAQAGSDAQRVFCFSQNLTRERTSRPLPGERPGYAGLSRRSGDQRHLRQAPRWLERAEVHRAESHIDVLHHQRNSERSNCRGDLCLLGVFISIVLELSGIPSLAFAVGVYLPISTSAPVWVGGLIRGLVDKYTRRKHAGANLTEDQLVAEGDKSNGVLLSSGYIAGGTLAGVVFAFLNIPLKDALRRDRKMVHGTQSIFRRPVRRICSR